MSEKMIELKRIQIDLEAAYRHIRNAGCDYALAPIEEYIAELEGCDRCCKWVREENTRLRKENIELHLAMRTANEKISALEYEIRPWESGRMARNYDL